MAAGDHLVQFYERSDDLVESVGGYLLHALRSGGVAVVVATPVHRTALEAAVRAGGVDLEEAARRGSFVSLDARRTLDSLLVDGSPDRARFDAAVGTVVRRAAGTAVPVHVYGEMVQVLWEAGRVNAAIELESAWNDLQSRVPFSLFCTYRRDAVEGRHHSTSVREVCRLHSRVLGEPPALSTGIPPVKVTERFPPEPQSARRARRLVVDALEGWSDDELIADAALVVTELAANAVVHAGSEFAVELVSSEGSVHISVLDSSALLPLTPRSDSSPSAPSVSDLRPGAATDLERVAASGRGLALIGSLARRWGSEPTADGKRVWAELGR